MKVYANGNYIDTFKSPAEAAQFIAECEYEDEMSNNEIIYTMK